MWSKRKPNWRRVRIPSLILAAGLVVMGGLSAADVAYNATPSMPVGWYIGVENGSKARIGDLVSFCAPVSTRQPFLPPGPCPGGNAPLIKQVVAVAGDLVEVKPAGVSINGRLLQSSAAVTWVKPAVGVYELKIGQVWAYGAGRPATSFDSRYYGPVVPDRVVRRLF